MKTTGMFGARAKSKERMRQALIAAGGNLTLAAKACGCSRANFNQMVTNHADLHDLVNELTEVKLDTVEDMIYTMGAEGKTLTALIAWANAKGKQRGWGYYRNETVHTGSIDHRHTHLHQHSHEHRIRLGKLSDKDLTKQIEARRAELPEAARSASIEELFWAGDPPADRPAVEVLPPKKG